MKIVTTDEKIEDKTTVYIAKPLKQFDRNGITKEMKEYLKFMEKHKNER